MSSKVPKESSHQGRTDESYFKEFVEDPKKFSTEVIQGAHKYIAKIIRDGEHGPTTQTLIKIFLPFSKNKIKPYLFKRMTKPILLELALCVIQDLALNGPARAKTLELELENSKSEGKVARIADPFAAEGDAEYDKAFLSEIDEAFFKFKDSSGKSPDVSLSAGQGHKAPYSPFGRDGAFVRPGAHASRILSEAFEVYILMPCSTLLHSPSALSRQKPAFKLMSFLLRTEICGRISRERSPQVAN